MPRGGRRPGAGAKAGIKRPKTLDKLLAREHLQRRVIARIDPLIDAQLANAEGIKYLVYRDSDSGKFVRVTEQTLEISQTENRIEVWDKDPSIQAFTDLMNRALDKPKEQDQDINLKVTGDLMAKVDAARKRAKKP